MEISTSRRHQEDSPPAEPRVGGPDDDGLDANEFEDTSIQMYEDSTVVGIYGPPTQSRMGILRSYLGTLWRRPSPKIDPIEESSSIVVVVGPPGGGRAGFISTITGQNVSPAAKSIRAVTCNNPDGSDSRITFIDSPSLKGDVVMLSDIEVKVREWIKTRHAKIENFVGIVYVQSITDPTFRDPPFTPFSRFLDIERSMLCQKCVIATTMWDQIDPATGVAREKELKMVWKDILSAGSRIVVLQNTRESAQSLVHSLLAPPHESSPNEMPAADAVLNPDMPIAEPLSPNDHRIINLPYVFASYLLGRRLDQTVILTVGKTGSGKSKTINRLISENILDVAKPGDGPTTKHPSRVTASFKTNPVNINVAFDEIPAHTDTDGTQQQFATLLRGYAETYFSPRVRDQDHNYFMRVTPHGPPSFRDRIFPNVILIVVTWESVKRDENDAPHLTSDIGQLMLSLNGLGLVDFELPNVVVAVTKSMTAYSTDYEDYDDDGKKNQQWRKDADKKTGIINALQQKVFPGSAKWSVVFIENGGGQRNLNDMTLPNGETSHRSLLEALRKILVLGELNQTSDLYGSLALDLLARVQPFSSVSTLRQDLDCDVKHNAASTILDDQNPSSPPRIEDLVRRTIGSTFNPVTGKFGWNCVLALDPSDIRINLSSDRQTELIYPREAPREDAKFIASQLHVDFEMRDIVGWSSCYSSSSSATPALSSGSRLHIIQKLIATAEAVPLRPRLSPEMIKEIERLPRWSGDTVDQYDKFFETYGTHVVLRAIFGGVLQILSRGKTKLDNSAVHTALEKNVPISSAGRGGGQQSGKSNDVVEIRVFLDGGGAVEPELSAAVEQLLTGNQDKSAPTGPGNWPEVRAKWIEALQTNPVFCPDEPQTDYWWLYNLDGLTDLQRKDLERASTFYLRTTK